MIQDMKALQDHEIRPDKTRNKNYNSNFLLTRPN